MNLADNIITLSGIGPAQAEKLARLEIYTISDLLYHLPFRYEDRRIISKSTSVHPGQMVTLVGKISGIKNEYSKNGKIIQKGEFVDDAGKMSIIWFNQSYLVRSLKKDCLLSFFGKVDWFGKKLVLINPEISDLDLAGSIVPVYPETAGLTSRFLRTKIKGILEKNKFEDKLPPHLGFPELNLSLHKIHFPENPNEIEKYRQRLAFDELLTFEMNNVKKKQDWQSRGVTQKFQINKLQISKFVESLPYKLTASQETAIKEILTDLEKPVAMNRLLEGDVGSGKTVVATIASLVCHANNLKTLFMAPTQILAYQHFETLNQLLSPFKIQVGITTAHKKVDGDVIVGTKSLLGLDFDEVGLVIIDEQHRFGVAQRTLLQHKGGVPHVLTMTATPIPRTMAMTLYGDLNLSILTDMPPGRKPVKTWIFPQEKRLKAIEWIKKQKTQVFWICSLIDESESLGSIRAVTKEFESLKLAFTHLKLGLLHGKMKPKEKDAVLQMFRNKDIDILVATPVVEVGIDIPSANIMVIEDAYRFGLAALHQLRGRVGRNEHQGYCLLFSNKDSIRLKAMETNHSGLLLAETDFKLRGAGDIYGEKQHGQLNFKITRYEDLELLPKVKEVVKMLT